LGFHPWILACDQPKNMLVLLWLLLVVVIVLKVPVLTIMLSFALIASHSFLPEFGVATRRIQPERKVACVPGNLGKAWLR